MNSEQYALSASFRRRRVLFCPELWPMVMKGDQPGHEVVFMASGVQLSINRVQVAVRNEMARGLVW